MIPSTSLSCRDAEHDGDLVEREVRRERLGERRRAVGVVRCVHEHARFGPDELEPAGRGRGGEPLGEHIAHEGLRPLPEERFDGRDGERGIVALVRAVEREEDVVVLPRESADGDHLAAHRDGGALEGESGCPRPERGLGEVDRPLELGEGRGRLHGGDHRGDRLDDPGLGPGDLLDRRAESLRVVEGDRREDRDLAVGDVGRVPLAAIPTSTTATSTGASAKAAKARTVKASK
jgi:hypothetical protein